MFNVYMIKKDGSGEMLLNSYKTKRECNNVVNYLLNECGAGKTIRFEIRQ